MQQLRQVLERGAARSTGGTLIIDENDLTAPGANKTYKEAKQEVVEAFTRDYLEALLARHNGNVSSAAREAGSTTRSQRSRPKPSSANIRTSWEARSRLQ